jgi:para-nitrobenzyl esterase
MINRNILLITILVLNSSFTFSSSDKSQIVTSSGIIEGIIKKNVILWDDIPYAKAPIGDLRWRAPMELLSDDIITPRINNSCVQEPSSLGGVNGDGLIVGQEDCLYLDIKAPQNINSSKPLPVMFWIHGGGNITGTKDIYDFSYIVKKYNVIVVTINYRLGPFGWFSHPSIQDFQDNLDKTSNFGTLDIIQALKWVRRNIDLFNGDANNVTIFGESAGGHNVLSLLVSPQANGLFHKAISQSGYTTSVSYEEAYGLKSTTSNLTHASHNVVSRLTKDQPSLPSNELNYFLKSLSADLIFQEYIGKSNLEIPLLTNDGIVIPKIGLENALKENSLIHAVPIIAGSNRDEVKLWNASAEYFVKTDYSLIGSIFGIPRVKIKNKASFDAINYYRSNAWQIRGVIQPLSGLIEAGNDNVYAYRYDWDDHRRYLVANFQDLIGAAHSTEIPLITGNNRLVGDYGFLLYPKGPSKRFTSKNMMSFWTNFAKTGNPGVSSNAISWKKYNKDDQFFMILDRKKDMRLRKFNTNFKSLVIELNEDNRLNELEKCVTLYQMGALIGNDIFNEIKKYSTFNCNRQKAIKFLELNSEFIKY